MQFPDVVLDQLAGLSNPPPDADQRKRCLQVSLHTSPPEAASRAQECQVRPGVRAASVWARGPRPLQSQCDN